MTDAAPTAAEGEPQLPDPGGQPRRTPVGTVVAVKGALPRLKRHDVQSLAAAVAFKIFLSLFPAAVAAVAIFSVFGDPAAVLDRMGAFVPPEVATLLEDRVLGVAETQGAGLLAVAGVLGGLWAASSAAVTLMKALNRINGVTQPRSFVPQRLTALLLTLALFVALGGLLALVVFGPQVRDLLLPDELLGGLAGPLFAVGQFLVAMGILVLLFAFIFWAGPNRRMEWHWWSPGALIGVVGWLIVSGGFTIYSQTAANFEATYAGLAGVIATLMWLQLSMMVLLFGAEVNAERARLLLRDEVVSDAAGMSLTEPTTDPLRVTPTRAELPLPVTTWNGHGRTRATVAAAAGVTAAAVVLAGTLGRRSRRR